jgi:polyhydroxyalkanoate synthesis repressor PhaR
MQSKSQRPQIVHDATKTEADEAKPSTVIKKYANRRLYNTGTSTYVTLEDLATMVKKGEDFTVNDAKSGEDITHSVLTQIIFEQENKGQNLLPVNVLRQLISFYGDSVQSLVPSYLEYSIEAFVRDQESIRKEMAHTFGATAIEAMRDQARRNTEIFRKAMSMFVPLGDANKEEAEDEASVSAAAKPKGSGELDDMKAQLAAMQARLDKLDKS